MEEEASQKCWEHGSAMLHGGSFQDPLKEVARKDFQHCGASCACIQVHESFYQEQGQVWLDLISKMKDFTLH